MTRSELIQRLSLKHRHLSPSDTDEGIRLILDTISNRLQEGHRIEIRSFGSFYVGKQLGRIGRNPKSGEAVVVPEKNIPRFKAGKELRERIMQSHESS